MLKKLVFLLVAFVLCCGRQEARSPDDHEDEESEIEVNDESQQQITCPVVPAISFKLVSVSAKENELEKYGERIEKSLNAELAECLNEALGQIGINQCHMDFNSDPYRVEVMIETADEINAAVIELFVDSLLSEDRVTTGCRYSTQERAPESYECDSTVTIECKVDEYSVYMSASSSYSPSSNTVEGSVVVNRGVNAVEYRFVAQPKE